MKSQVLLKYYTNKFAFLLYVAACFAGCLYQIYGFCDNFFAFRTSTEITVYITDTIRYPGVVVCFPYVSLMTTQRNNLTIREIFHLSPNANEALSYCKTTSPNGMKTSNNSECNNYFTPTKHFRGNLLCYRFVASKKLGYNYSVSRIANALYNSHRVYDLYFSKAFQKSSFIYIFSFSYPEVQADDYENLKTYPYESQKFGKIVARFSQSVNIIVFRNHILEYKLLPEPYDTKCTVSSKNNYFSCMESLLKKTLFRYPIDAFTSEPNDLKPISPLDLYNENITKAVREANFKCGPLY